MTLAALIAILAPLAGAALVPVLERVAPRLRDAGAVACSGAAAAAALSLLPALSHPEALPVERQVRWLQQPLALDVGVLVDPLSIVLANVVAVISFVIMVYSLGYMRGDPERARFWMWMNGFIGTMLLLVFASNLLVLFVGWKLVGVCSYGLIGYHYRDGREHWIGGPPPARFVKPSEAATKALVTTGVGDMLMLAGILLLYGHAGTLNFRELLATAPTWLAAMTDTPGMIELVSLLLLAGPLAKSAQFPFQEWLPEAMAGPGPVSALIHAATMVKSGVYLAARLLPLFYYGYWTAGIEAAGWFFHAAAWIGAGTALLAATQGVVAKELKKVLAYSTVSQIGYMFLALGAAGLAPGLLAAGYTAAILHLVSHAMFKACLFLCAGTVIHAAHSIYLAGMGGMRRQLPLTWGFTLVAALSLMGVPPLPGFWSKDAVLLAVAAASTPLLVVGLAVAVLTAFYTVRFVGLAFHGPASPALAAAGPRAHGGDGTFVMRLATGLLVAAIIAAGLAGTGVESALHHGFESELAAAAAGSGEDAAAGWLAVVPVLALLGAAAGSWPAYRRYVARRDGTRRRARWLDRMYGWSWNRWGLDTLYTRLFVDGVDRGGRLVAEHVETRLDAAVHETLPALCMPGPLRLLRRMRTDAPALLDNVSYVLVALAVLLTCLFLAAGGD